MATKERKPNKLVVWLKDHPMPACVIVLSLIALIAGLLLGGVNQLTYQSPEEKLAKNLSKAYASDAGWTKVENLSDYNVAKRFFNDAYGGLQERGRRERRLYLHDFRKRIQVGA